MQPIKPNRKQRRFLNTIIGKALWALTLPLDAACWLLGFYIEWYDAEALRHYLSGKRHTWRTEGFTLIELSIVLVIIGLIIGGVIVGQELIKTATVRAEISSLTRFEVAYNTFRIKYNCIPGDCANATTFFSSAQNGNGNGMIDIYPPGTDGEGGYAWQDLSLAGLISGSFNGNGGTPLPYGACPFAVCPQSKLNPADTLVMGGVNDYQTGGQPVYGLGITLSDVYTGIGWANTTNAAIAGLRVYDVFYIDLKLDDGIADRGRFITVNDNQVSGNCVTGGYTVTNGSVNYNLTDTTLDCDPIYIMH